MEKKNRKKRESIYLYIIIYKRMHTYDVIQVPKKGAVSIPFCTQQICKSFSKKKTKNQPKSFEHNCGAVRMHVVQCEAFGSVRIEHLPC